MGYFNKVKQVQNDFEWPLEFTPLTVVNSKTDAKGSIKIDYEGINQINSTAIQIFKANPPFVPNTQYTKTGVNLYTGTQLVFDYASCTKGSRVIFTFNYQCINSLINPSDGDYYTVEVTINDTITILFIIKIADKVI
jgi:hypothetical protein|tara:strand:+ start:6369 stop:6779 length:411 start_codon:yes stop_codon:yes gene_type:complete